MTRTESPPRSLRDPAGRRRRRGPRSPVFVAGLGALACVLLAAAPSDRFLEGYATAIVERDLGLRRVHVEVRGGRARVEIGELGSVTEDRIVRALSLVDGIEAVEVREAPPAATTTPATTDVASAGDPAAVALPAEDTGDDGEGLEVLPRTELFEPLLADPRQPHFSASFQWYSHDPELTHVGSATFGEHFALLGGPLGEARWELGLLAGVFSIFDLDADSHDLVNSDFLVGPTLSVRRGRLSGQVRLYHQSSHLGDEFLLRNRTTRINLSYEGVDALASFDVHPAVRLYAGGGAIVHDEPALDPWSVQAGIEVESPWTVLGGALRPIAAGDFQFRQENDWTDEISARGGVQIENPRLSRLRLQILFEYFRGNSPNGQFFERRIEYYGVGGHLHF